MSLNQQFFIERDIEIMQREICGEVELEIFLQRHDLTVQQFKNAGLLDEKPIASTTELYDYKPTDKGRQFFKAIERQQIIVVKKDKAEALLDLLK